MIPSLKVITRLTSAASGNCSRSSPYSSIIPSKASVSTARHSRLTSATRSRDVGPVPAERLQLEPDLRIAGGEVGLEVAHRRPPLLDAGEVGAPVHRALAGDQALGEPFEHAHEQVLHRAEVVVDEAMVGAGLLGQAARADARIADARSGAARRRRGRRPRSRPGSTAAPPPSRPRSPPAARELRHARPQNQQRAGHHPAPERGREQQLLTGVMRDHGHWKISVVQSPPSQARLVRPRGTAGPVVEVDEEIAGRPSSRQRDRSPP